MRTIEWNAKFKWSIDERDCVSLFILVGCRKVNQQSMSLKLNTLQVLSEDSRDNKYQYYL